MIFEWWVVFPYRVNFSSLPNHDSTNFVISLFSINTPSTKCWFSDILDSLETSICKIFSHIKNFSLWWIFIIMNFPNTDFFFIKVCQKILKNLELIFTVLEFSFKVIKLKPSNLLFFLFCLFCFWSFFLLRFLLFLFCLLWFFIFCLGFHFWFFLSFEFNFKCLFSAKNNFSKIFGKNRDGSYIIIPSKEIEKFFSLTFSHNQSIFIGMCYLKRF